MKTLISIDPGMSSAIVVGTYSDTQPYELTHAFQIEGGLEGFLKSVRHRDDTDDFSSGGTCFSVRASSGSRRDDLCLWFGDILGREYEEPPVFLVEKFKPRGAGNNFAYKTNDLEPLRIEGAIRAMGIDPVWVQPAQQYFAGGESKSSTTNAHRWLKANGLHITGKDVGCKDANDARSALLHSISFLRRSKHKPTLEKYFPRG